MSAQLYNAEIIFCLWYLLPCLRVRGLFEKPTKKTCHCSTFRKTTLIPNLMEEWLKPKFFSLKKIHKKFSDTGFFKAELWCYIHESLKGYILLTCIYKAKQPCYASNWGFLFGWVFFSLHHASCNHSSSV